MRRIQLTSIIQNTLRSIQSGPRLCISLLLFCCFFIGSQTVARATDYGPATTTAQLRQYLQQAQRGDTILLQYDATFYGPIVLPVPAGSTGWVTIRTSHTNLAPPDGHRITSAYSPVIPKILSPGANQPAICTGIYTPEHPDGICASAATHHYRLMGIEVSVSEAAAQLWTLIEIGTGGETALNQAHHITFDRCYIHGHPEQTSSGYVRTGLSLNGAHLEVINSEISNFRATVIDEPHAISAWNGSGPFKIINNFLEASGVNVLFGGSYANTGMNPGNLEFRHNLVSKRPAWRNTTPCIKVKNLFELKDMRVAAIDNNVFEYNWPGCGQAGYAILIEPATSNSGGSGLNAAVEDIEFTNNIVRHSSGAFHIAGTDNCWPQAGCIENPPALAKRIALRNNLIYDIGLNWGSNLGEARFLLLNSGPGPLNLTVDHNTVSQDGHIALFDLAGGAGAASGFIFNNNVVRHNANVAGGISYGINDTRDGTGTAVPEGSPTMQLYSPGYSFQKNLVGGEAFGTYPASYPQTGNFYPTTFAAAGFVSLTANTENFRLAPTSSYRNLGTDGKDLGVNLDAHTVALRSSDFDGDRKTETAVWRPSDGAWYVLSSYDDSVRQHQFGSSGDVAAPGDYDGDRQTDYALFRPSNGYWYVLKSSNAFSMTSQFFGTASDVPMPGDYDADGKTDFAVFRPSNSAWYVRRSSDGVETSLFWGSSGDKPVPGDFDGDGKADFAVFRPSTNGWYILNSFNGTIRTQVWGSSGDVPVPGDYDGDGRLDIAVFRPSSNTWYILKSSNGDTLAHTWGSSGDKLVPGDYDGDGKTDVAVWRPSSGAWYILQSSNQTLKAVTWGTSGDIPVASSYLP